MSKATAARSLAMASLVSVLALIPAQPERALAQASPWTQGEKSRTRLIGAGAPEGGRHLAGVEIRLAPRSLTYWKLPGDAGVPPAFSFEGSRNLASATPLYPPPRRFPEAGGEAFGYMDEVVFPLIVTPVDPARPVNLVLKFDYATCEQLCIPAQASLRLDLAPRGGPSAEAGLLRAWLARTPRRDDPAAPKPVVMRQGPEAWTLRFSGEPPVDVFAEGPQDWYFDTKRAGEGFDLLLAQKPADAAPGPVEATLTVVYADRAFEMRTTLDVGLTRP